jgi:hypothetical protein
MKQVREKKTAGTHRNADYLLKNTTMKLNKYVVNQKLELFDDISFKELYGRIKVVAYKIRFVPSYDKVFVFRLAICFWV